ncbi:hypothetical protein SAMN05421788_105258 [Filimonas lacunae]|uniref:Uncharacterized protein n=1 Tax=Filimonas lacunae TaxID=477680 RepID=A0A1N7QH68_9BACT|nr:DUF6520 family protein [Filimonas lacunae]SIT22212.1 hypothetical protein SAMN05421788_105258 [Filimonas lacunae]
MKKMKVTFMLVAVCLGIGGAFASKKFNAACIDNQQYIYVSGVGYMEVYPATYICASNSSAICTYYKSNIAPVTYTICVYGIYTTQ